MQASAKRTGITALLLGISITGVAWYVFGRDHAAPAPDTSHGASPQEPPPVTGGRLEGEADLEFEITGSVTDADGTAVEGAKIVVTFVGDGFETGTEKLSGTAGPGGKFQLPFVDMPGASFERVDASHPELGNATRSLEGITASGHLDVGKLVLHP